MTTLSVDPTGAGDLLALAISGPPTSFTVSSISGGGVSAWTKAVGFATSVGADEEIWFGKVATTGTSTITVTWSSSVASQDPEYAAQEFTSSLGSTTVWGVDQTGTRNNTSSSTTTTYPSLSPSGSGELYFGYMLDATATGGSTSGFTYANTAQGNQVTYNPGASSPSAYQPTGTQSPSDPSSGEAATFTASSPGAISAVGTLTTTSGTGATTISVDPTTAGDMLVVSILDTGTPTVTALSGGGVTAWTKAVGAGSGFDDEIWYGKVTTPGTATITATWSGSVASDVTEYSAREFTAGLGASTTWSVDHTGTQSNTTSSTITYPSLSPSATGELYFGFATDNNATGGSTSGFTYANTATNNQVTYNPNVSSPNAYQPTGTQSPSDTSFAEGALFVATVASAGPVVTAVSPASGATSGGTSVTITGTNFSGASAVKFGTTSATSFTVNSDTSITAIDPAKSSGTIDVTVTVPGTDTTQDVYDVLGRLVCEASPDATASGIACPSAGSARVAGTTTYGYDADSELTSETDPLGNATAYSYDGDGNQTLMTDAQSRETKTAYDADDRKTAVTTGYGSGVAATTGYAYDLAPGTSPCSTLTGSTYCTSMTDPNSLVTVDYYNALDQMMKETQPSSGTTTHTYDPAGNLLTTTTPAGTATYGYDDDNRVTSITYSGAASGYSTSSNVTYTYNDDGLRTQMTDGTGTTSYTYDTLDELTSTENGASATVGYTYENDGNVASITYPNSSVVHRTYNGAGELSSVSDFQGRTTNFTYDPDGNLLTSVEPNGTTQSQSFDADDQESAVALTPTITLGSTTASVGYGRDGTELVTSETDTGSLSASPTYSYDAQGRLHAVGSSNYGYDSGGDITGLTSGATLSYTSGTLSSSSLSGVTTTYGSDSIGARTSTTIGSGSPSSYSYNQVGELVGATPSGGSAYNYGYNGDGLRMSKTVSSTTEAFTYDPVTGGSTPLLLVDGSTNFIYGPNNLVIEQEDNSSAGAPQFLVHDQLGSTRLLVNALGTVDMTATYDPYGKVTSSSGSASTPIGYASAYTDAETSFLYLVHRYYDPVTGQFLTVDPEVDETGQAYTYAGDAPIDGTDPLGLCSTSGGSYLVPGACQWTSKAWVAQTEATLQGQKGAGGFSLSNGLSAVEGVGDAVASHWRGIAHVTLVATAVVAGVTCAVATEGVCATFAGTLVATVLGGAAEGAVDHAIDGCNQTAEGYLASAAEGSLRESAFALPEELLLGGEAEHAAPANFWQTARSLFANF